MDTAGVPSRRPTARFLVHGAERSGPPLHLLRMCRWWAGHPPGFDVEIVLARPGELVAEFKEVATTRVARLDPRSAERRGERMLNSVGMTGLASRVVATGTRRRIASGTRSARDDILTIVNGATSATTHLLRILDPAGAVLMIAHELSTGWQSNINSDDRTLLLDRCDRYAAVSRSVAAYLVSLEVAEPKISVIPPAIDRPEDARREARSRRRDERSPIVIGGGGVTDWRKAPELWLQVAAHVRRLAPEVPVRFVWFGGSQAGEVAHWPIGHELDHLGLSDHVDFLGPINDPYLALSDMDIFVSTAREDAAPMVCAEAARCGVPVITFDTGGAVELVLDGDCGRVVQYPDTQIMAAEVVELMRHPQLRSEMGRRGESFTSMERDTAVIAHLTANWILEGAS